MPYVTSDRLPELGEAPAASPERPRTPSRPGWPEIVVGLITLAVIGVGVGS